MSLEAQYRKTLSEIGDKLRPIVNKDGAMTVTEAVDALAARLAEAERLPQAVTSCNCSHCRWLLEQVTADSAEPGESECLK